jgi:hypothetical protein
MFGGAPTMPPPGMMPMQTMPMQTMPMQTMPVQVPQPWPPKAPPQTTTPGGGSPNWAPPVASGGQPTGQWQGRGKIDFDEPPPLPRPPTPTPPPPVHLPAPEEVGVAAPRPVSKVDWNALRERLQQLGGVGFQTAQLPDGNYRVAFVMRTNQANCFHNIEVTAVTETEAANVALARAEQWASGK